MKLTAVIFIATLMGTILGMAYIFTGITGSSGLEQVIAAIGISPGSTARCSASPPA
jgi:hypothetical protein